MTNEITIDEAWATASAELPADWRFSLSPLHPEGWEALAYDVERSDGTSATAHLRRLVSGETPQAALLALADALRADPPLVAPAVTDPMEALSLAIGTVWWCGEHIGDPPHPCEHNREAAGEVTAELNRLGFSLERDLLP